MKEKDKKTKEEKGMLKNKNGITLIALVVTIVVLLILAGVSISLVLDNNGIINRSKEAKNQYAQSRKNEQEDLENTSEWIDEQVTGNPRPIKVAVNTRAKANGTINGKKATSNNPIIPEGYTPIDTNTSKWGDGSLAPTTDYVNHGLVIKDDSNNEWVWIPVPDVTVMCDTANTIEYTLDGTDNVTTKLYSKSIKVETDADSINPYENEESQGAPRGIPGNTNIFREPDLVARDWRIGDDYDLNEQYYNGILGFESPEEMAKAGVANYNEMINSISRYGGFYIGRYELSSEGVQKNAPTLTNTNWYNLYAFCKELNASDKVETQMIWGCQWDMACNFIASKGEKKSVVDSRSWGNYMDSIDEAAEGNYSKESLQNTGSNEAWKANNIYDLAGNCVEWTQEAHQSNLYPTQCRVYRGGYSQWSGQEGAACSREKNSGTPLNEWTDLCTRPTLIVK